MARDPRRPRTNSGAPQLFGAVLRHLRVKAGYSQDSFAHRTGYHRNYIGQLERGEKSPSLTALFVLSDSLEARASEVIRRVEVLRKRSGVNPIRGKK